MEACKMLWASISALKCNTAVGPSEQKAAEFAARGATPPCGKGRTRILHVTPRVARPRDDSTRVPRIAATRSPAVEMRPIIMIIIIL